MLMGCWRRQGSGRMAGEGLAYACFSSHLWAFSTMCPAGRSGGTRWGLGHTAGLGVLCSSVGWPACRLMAARVGIGRQQWEELCCLQLAAWKEHTRPESSTSASGMRVTGTPCPSRLWSAGWGLLLWGAGAVLLARSWTCQNQTASELL